MRRPRALLLAAFLVLTALTALPVAAADTPLSFDDPVRQQRYDDLLAELRCLVCQNQSLADSHADLAQDLRDEVYRMLDEGAGDAEILDFMVERYGDFVLYRPPLRASTVLLWGAPLLLALVAIGVVVRLARRRAPPPAALSDEERARLAALVADEKRGQP